MTEEKLFENRVKSFLKTQNCYFIKYWGGGAFTKAGVPDILCCCNGRFLGIEIKSSKGKLSELQKLNLRNINACGGCGIVLYPGNFHDFKKLILRLNAVEKFA